MTKTRLDKLLAQSANVSRKDARGCLRAGRVSVDGKTERDAGRLIDTEANNVELNGEKLDLRAHRHIMLHKPAGLVTAAEDARLETVMELLPPTLAARGCMPVGRLDRDAEGLLLLTTDGRLAHRLLSPRRHVDKAYFVRVEKPLDEADVAAFAEGLELSDFTALPARLAIGESPFEAEVTLREGKFHQVKRMFAAQGKPVAYLKRVQFGSLALDDTLAPGAWRELTEDEIAKLYADAEGSSDA